jgi:hypothetical protein
MSDCAGAAAAGGCGRSGPSPLGALVNLSSLAAPVAAAMLLALLIVAHALG